MAKFQTNTKSKDYLKDKEAFLRELKQFNESKGIPYKTPAVNGIDIDLYLFYSLVQQRGGFNKVNLRDSWDSYLRPLKLPYPCINGSTLLKKIYGTYLEKFEKAKGPPGRDDDIDLDDDPRRGRGGGIPRVSYGGAYISASGEQLRTGSRAVAGSSERLALSLISPMPNEQDFAVNVCTVLAADHSNRLPLSSTPHILDFLLAHAGVYNHPSLRDTIGRSYYEARGKYPDEFWRLRAGGGGARELADETKFMAPGLEEPDLMVQAMAAHNNLTDRLYNEEDEPEVMEKIVEEDILEDWVAEPSEEDQLFAPELGGGAKCVYTQRVLQVASIVRSLSFHDENVPTLAKNNTLIRFLLLCANCWVGSLRQSGLDTLGNICTELVIKVKQNSTLLQREESDSSIPRLWHLRHELARGANHLRYGTVLYPEEPATCLLSRHILSTIQAALVSADRARVLSALEMLNKLSQNEANEDVLLRALDSKVYGEVCSLLTVRDIMLLVCALECVYALTSLGERACERVARCPGLVHTLVSLTTVEAQSYGPRACILMRVVETVSGPSAIAAAAEQQAQAQAQVQVQAQAHPPPPPVPQQQPQTPVKQPVVEQRPPPAPTTSQAPVTPAPVSSIQQAHMQQKTVQENEQFALAWLRASYAPLPPADNSGCDAGELYRQYLHCCAKLSRKGVIAPQHFPRLVRTVFGGTVGPNSVTTSTGETVQMYIGIKSRNPQAKTNLPAGPSSPILKAQLTNKAAAAEVKPAVSQAQAQQATTHPHLSQALDTGASSTSLIKHLLAHKVSPAQPNVQVAQRQQNQQRVGPAPAGVAQTSSSGMELDPEALIKCTTIIPGGVASTTPGALDKVVLSTSEESVVPKEEPVQIQIDEQAQLTIKTAQNKMLADLLEKKSNPPVQVVQMSSNQMNAPTIQITETGQIVQVKSDPLVQITADSGQIVSQSGPYFQIKNEAGQVIQLKNEQGQIIQLKSEQPGVKSEVEAVVAADHSYTEPPTKKLKVEEKREKSPQESVSKTAANLYAALAASALEDEEDLVQQPTMQVQQPTLQVQQPTLQVQQPTLQVQPPTLQVQQPTLQMQQPTLQMQQPTLQMQQQTIQMAPQTMQMQQPMLQVQPMDVQNIMASQSGQLILQDKTMATQQTQYVQQPMQIIATPSNAQGGISYLAQNIPGNMMQKTIIIVQGATGGGPITLTVNNPPGGLDEATLNSVIAQATEAITQQQIIQNSGVIQSGQRVIVSQPALLSVSQPMTMVKATLTQNAPQLTPSQQPIITSQPQPHKAQIVNSQQQIVVTQKNPPALVPSSSSQQLMANQKVIQGNQQLITSTQQVIQSNQQIIQGNQQLLQGNQQIIAVSNNQQIIMNAPMKGSVHRVVQSQRSIQTVAVSESKTSVIQATSTSTASQPVVRQVIRQPVMMGGTKIGEKEVLVTQPVAEVPQLVPAKSTTPTPVAVAKQVEPQAPMQSTLGPDETPWICHWRGCSKTFESAGGVFKHAARTHCPQNAQGEAPCLWLDCDRVPRKTFALLNHLNDRHCTADALKAVFNSRRHIATDPDSNKAVALGYPPNAALAALNKHAAEFLNPRELMDENEGPVTKSIRLTAALILRNLVIYSNTGRRHLRGYEPHLATIALSNVEASRTIAQVLYDMNNI